MPAIGSVDLPISPRLDFTQLLADVQAAIAALPAEAKTEAADEASAPRPGDLVLQDQDGDEIHLLVANQQYEVLVETKGEAGVNLNGGNLDAAIDFLTQARDYHRGTA